MFEDLLRYNDPDEEVKAKRRAKKVKPSSQPDKRQKRQNIQKKSFFTVGVYSAVVKIIGFVFALAAVALIVYAVYLGVSFII